MADHRGQSESSESSAESGNPDCWMQTYSGIQFDLANPTPEMVNINDIATSLSRQVRFNGHTRQSINIAQHSLLVADMVLDAGGDKGMQLAALFHDGHEAYLSDVPSPVKWILGSAWHKWKLLEQSIDWVIAESIGFDFNHLSDPLIKLADVSALYWEKTHLLDDKHEWPWDDLLGGNDPLPLPIDWHESDLSDPWTPPFVEKIFLEDAALLRSLHA